MPALINLKTNLKSLGYGNDRPDGGSSNQPYVVTPIPDGEALRTIAPDFLLRNGYLNAINSLDDVERIGKWFIDLKSPSGLLFTVKQELLERQNPDIDDGINRVYNPFSTVLQTGFLSTGLHLNKQGINPYEESYYVGGKTGYYSFTNAQKSPEILDDHFLNRLAASYLIKKTNQTSIPNFFYVNKNEPNILLSYPGGPGSTLGIGNTNIRIQNSTGPVTNISPQQKFQPSYTSELIYSEGYLTPNKKRPHVNYIYNPSLVTGSSISALNAFKPFFNESFEGETKVDLFTFNISNLLNRGEYVSDPNLYTSSLNPNIGVPKNDNGIAYRVSSRTTEKHPWINWAYDIATYSGVSSTVFLETEWGSGEAEANASDILFPSSSTLNKTSNNIANNDSRLNYSSGITGFEYDTNNSDPKTSLIPYNKHPWITWAYDLANYNSISSTLFLETEWGNAEAELNASDILFPSDFTLNKDNNVIANNTNIAKYENVGATKRFEYNDDNITDINTYLIPLGSNVAAIYKYGASTRYLDKYGKSGEDILTNVESNELKPFPSNDNISRNEEASNIDDGNNVFTFSYSQTLSQLSKAKDQSTGLDNIKDFRKTLVDDSNGTITSLPSTDYNTFNRTKTYKTSVTTYKGNHNGTNYVLDPNTGISSDLVNNDGEDLIDFKFITYNASNTTDTIYFRAYLEDWNDSFKADFGSIKYMGRGESLYKYEGFGRDASVSFNVPILSALDLTSTYARLNRLINTVAPFYSTGTASGVSGLLTGVITKITMGDYWKNMPILVKDIGFSPIDDMGWDIGRAVDGKRTNTQLPKGIKVNMSFIVIHDKTPQYGINFIN